MLNDRGNMVAASADDPVSAVGSQTPGMAAPGAPNTADILFTIFGLPITGEKLSYASVVLLITILLIVTSLLTIIAIVTSETLKDVIGHYLLSLAITDLLIGTLVTPLAFYAALDEQWQYANNRILWKIEAYLEITLWSTTAYVFMWIGVDRYAALTKPSRYEVEQTFTRCKCWIVFTWVTSALLSCPTLFGEMQARYYHEAFICILDWSAMAPYSVTLGVLVIVPSLVSVAYSYSFILRKLQNPEDLEDNQKALLETDPSYMMTFFVILTFVVSWLPWFALRAYETLFRHDLHSKPLHFCLLWLAIGGGNWKILIYTTMNPEFRKSIRAFYESVCCACCRDTRSHPHHNSTTHGGHPGVSGINTSRSSSQYTVIASSTKHNRFF